MPEMLRLWLWPWLLPSWQAARGVVEQRHKNHGV